MRDADLEVIYDSEHDMTLRALHILSTPTPPRVEYLHGRKHLVVPVVALMEGIIQAVNAEVEEFVPQEVLHAYADTWNGRPCVIGHPTQDGEQVSANDPAILAQRAFGTIFHARGAGRKMPLEAWCDEARLEALGEHQLLEDLRAGRAVEISVGGSVRILKEKGTYLGKPYTQKWAAAYGDHLAFLPGGRGACSVEMGCGANRAASYNFEADEIREIKVVERRPSPPLTPIVPEDTPMADAPKDNEPKVASLREKLKALMAAMRANALFDTAEQAASEEAAELVGYQSLRALFDQVGKSWDEGSGLINDLIADETESPTQTPAQEEAEEEVETARLDALIAHTQSMISALYSIQNQVFKICEPDISTSDPRYMEAFRAAVGKTISAKNMKMVQASHDASHAMHDHTTALGADCPSSSLAARSAAASEDTMKKSELIRALIACPCSGFKAGDEAMLEAFSDERLTEFKTASDGRAAADTKAAAAATTAAEQLTATTQRLTALEEARTKPMTDDELLKQASPTLRSLVASVQVAEKAEKEELVKSLAAVTAGIFTEDELKTKELPELRTLAAVAKLEQPRVLNFAGRGVARVPDEPKTDTKSYEPPDSYKAGLEARRASAK